MKRLAIVAVYSTILGLTASTVFAAKPAVRAMAKAEIPQGFAVGSGEPPLALRVDIIDGKASAVEAAAGGAANVTASGSTDDGEATLSIRHDLEVALKFDLYISADGERFQYTSSCAVTPGMSSFELWQQPVRAFALGNPRVIDGDRITCD